MKPFLMYRDRDLDLHQALLWNAQDLRQDLELGTLLGAMAGGDGTILEVASKVLLSGLETDIDTILYRQKILIDCLENESVVADIYKLSVEILDIAKHDWWGISGQYPSSVLYGSINLLESSSATLRKLRSLAEEHASHFRSPGFCTFFSMLRKELSEEYLSIVQNELTELKFRQGVLISGALGDSNETTNYVLLQPSGQKPNWLDRLFGKVPSGYTFRVHERDEEGARILSEMRNRGISRVAVALADSAEHVLGFFRMLRSELAFYMGCLALHRHLKSLGAPVCFPTPIPAGERRHAFIELYDVCLSLQKGERAVGNSVNADHRSIVIITGANQGGKSTFLRSIGVAQLMMQCGMFVGAKAFTAEICTALFTHYKREEDADLKSGRFDEELARMSGIVDHLVPGSILLCNESFSATNEREGSEIAKQIVLALFEKRIRVFYVTHLFKFAHDLLDMRIEESIFLRAERMPDGKRTFRLMEGDPLETSYGEDLYREVFQVNAENVGAS